MRQVVIALDQLANTLAGGMADETLSARAWRLDIERGRAWPRRIIDAIFFLDPDHCEQSWRSEIERRQLPDHYRLKEPSRMPEPHATLTGSALALADATLAQAPETAEILACLRRIEQRLPGVTGAVEGSEIGRRSGVQ